MLSGRLGQPVMTKIKRTQIAEVADFLGDFCEVVVGKNERFETDLLPCG